jgi:uncharacterized protein YehS (DUF1456 family)
LKTNKILKEIVEALSLKNEDIQSIFRLENYPIEIDYISNMFIDEQQDNFVSCSYNELGLFLDGLITSKRGVVTSTKKDEIIELSNNIILKKLRIALELKSAELIILFALVDIDFKIHEVNAFFRKEGTKNYKVCSDQILYLFLEGLDEFYYDGV